MPGVLAQELPHALNLERWLTRTGCFLSQAITAAVEGCRQEVLPLLQKYPDLFQRLDQPDDALAHWEANREVDHLLDKHFGRTRGVRLSEAGVFKLPARVAAPALGGLEVLFNSNPAAGSLQCCGEGRGYLRFRMHDFWPLLGSPDAPVYGARVRPEVAAVVFRDLELLVQEMTLGAAPPVHWTSDLERLADPREVAAACRGFAARLFFSRPGLRRFDLAAARARLDPTADVFTLLRTFDHPSLTVRGRPSGELFAAACLQIAAALASLCAHRSRAGRRLPSVPVLHA